MNISLLSASGHKIGASKGIGLLYIKEGIELEQRLFGGSQEMNRRAGTENVAGIAGFSKAIEITRKHDVKKVRIVRDYFISQLENIGGKINGSKEKRLSNIVSVTFDCDAENLMIFLSGKGIMCSTRSACDEKSKKESRVLESIGLKEKEIKGTLRFSLGFDTNKKDIDYVIREIKKFIKMNS